jgi:hypothetical protein
MPDQEAETAKHLVLDCIYAQTVWNALADWSEVHLPVMQRNKFEMPAEWWLYMSSNLDRDALTIAIYGAWQIF